jgi:hypothetical protein
MKCHSEWSEESRSASRGSLNKDQGEIPHGVYPERQSEILRSAQNDKRRAQDDSEWLGMTGLAIFSHPQTVWTYPPPARGLSIIQLW